MINSLDFLMLILEMNVQLQTNPNNTFHLTRSHRRLLFNSSDGCHCVQSYYFFSLCITLKIEYATFNGISYHKFGFSQAKCLDTNSFFILNLVFRLVQ